MEANVNGGAAATPTRAMRAHEWIRVLSEMPSRAAGSAAEGLAAERIGSWMRDVGAASVNTAPVPGRPRTALLFVLHGGLGALACWWGGLFGVALGLLTAWSFSRDVRQRRPLLARLLPTPASVNVIGRAGPTTGARRVVLSAHIDTAQAGFIFRPFWAGLFARFQQRNDQPPPGALALPETLLFIGAAISLVGWMGAHGFLFGMARLVLIVLLLVVCGIGLEWLAAPLTPGANDNASAVAAMLLCAETLRTQLPGDTELWIVGSGSEEDGCNGMHAFVAQHRDWSRETSHFVNFECVGGGTLHYIRTEGMLLRHVYPPPLIELARRVAAGNGFGEITPVDLLAATDGHVPAEHGYPALSLICLEAYGVPRNYHRIEDTVERIDLDCVVRAADFGAAVALAALRGAAGPLDSPVA